MNEQLIDCLIFVPIGYVLGSIPFGLIAGYIFGAGDIRRVGSGKSGMTNVMRTVGYKVGAAVLFLDMGKAVGTIALTRYGFDAFEGAVAGAGLAALCGHIWPVFSGFKGGRGVATGWGGLIILSPISGLAATVLGLSIVGLTRYVSLASITSAVSGSVILIVLAAVGREPFSYMWYGIIGAPLIVYLHRDNIGRLLRGEERKLGQKVEEEAEEEPGPTGEGSG